MTTLLGARALHAGASDVSFHWLEPGERAGRVVAQRLAIYGAELGWLGDASVAAWDEYDRHSSLLVAYRAGELIASSRLTLESDGPLEVSDLVDWKSGLAPGVQNAVAAEWSRVMIEKPYRQQGLFRAMYGILLRRARSRGARVLAGASVAGLRPHYEALGFSYLARPFRSSFFPGSPIYYPAYRVLG